MSSCPCRPPLGITFYHVRPAASLRAGMPERAVDHRRRKFCVIKPWQNEHARRTGFARHLALQLAMRSAPKMTKRSQVEKCSELNASTPWVAQERNPLAERAE